MGALQDSEAVVTGGSYTANVKTYLTLDLNGNSVMVQGVVLLGLDGAPLSPMSETTGRALLQALLQLDAKISQFIGALPNTTTEGLPGA